MQGGRNGPGALWAGEGYRVKDGGGEGELRTLPSGRGDIQTSCWAVGGSPPALGWCSGELSLVFPSPVWLQKAPSLTNAIVSPNLSAP